MVSPFRGLTKRTVVTPSAKGEPYGTELGLYLSSAASALLPASGDQNWRSAAAYAGGEAYLRQALIRHVSEVELEFAERLRRAYYFNYPRKLARLITQFVLSVEPTREGADPELVEDFSRSGLRTGEGMRQFSTLLNGSARYFSVRSSSITPAQFIPKAKSYVLPAASV